jgi:class 3 adenylate cyclase
MTIIQRILLGFAVLIGCQGLMSAGITLLSFQAITRAGTIARTGDGVLISLLEARRREKDYLLRHDLKYIHPTPDQPELSVDYHLAKLKSYVTEWQAVEENPKQAEILDDARRYHEGLLKVVDRLEKRGNETTGLIGKWRDLAHQIEKQLNETGDPKPSLLLLQIRRHEKDYLVRRGDEYVLKTRQAVRELDRWLETHQGQVPEARAIQAQLSQYLDLFEHVTDLDRENVILTEEFRRRAEDVGLDAAQVAAAGWERAHQEKRRLYYQQFWSGVVALLLTLLVSSFLARAIARPIQAVAETSQSLAEGKLESRVRMHASGEIGLLIDSTNKMAERLQQALGQLQGVNQDLQRQVEAVVAKVDKARSLQRFLPPRLVDAILEGRSVDLGIARSRQKLTLLFADLVGFTAFTDQHDPDEVSRVLNEYLSVMSEITFAHGGTIDKFIGDGIMIFFGAPTSEGEQEDARRCVAMALDMLQALKDLRGKWAHLGLELTGLRIGINTGYAAVGNFGSERRLEYTAIGGAVNLASRLEGVSQPNAVTISQATYLLVQDSFRCQPRGEVHVKGIQKPVAIYEVLPADGGEAGRVESPWKDRIITPVRR